MRVRLLNDAVIQLQVKGIELKSTDHYSIQRCANIQQNYYTVSRVRQLKKGDTISINSSAQLEAL